MTDQQECMHEVPANECTFCAVETEQIPDSGNQKTEQERRGVTKTEARGRAIHQPEQPTCGCKPNMSGYVVHECEPEQRDDEARDLPAVRDLLASNTVLDKPSTACEYPGCTNAATMTYGTDYTPVCDQHSGWHTRDESRAPAVETEQDDAVKVGEPGWLEAVGLNVEPERDTSSIDPSNARNIEPEQSSA